MINYVVEYDENLSSTLRALDDCMNSLHRHHRAHAEDGIPFWLNLHLSILYKIAWHARIAIAKWADKHANRWIETEDVRIDNIDWNKLSPFEVRLAIENAEENLREAREAAAA